MLEFSSFKSLFIPCKFNLSDDIVFYSFLRQLKSLSGARGQRAIHLSHTGPKLLYFTRKQFRVKGNGNEKLIWMSVLQIYFSIFSSDQINNWIVLDTNLPHAKYLSYQGPVV